MPTVSIIMPVYNRDKIILESLNHLTKQNYRPLEVIIIDDGSNDNTLDTINSYIKKNFDEKINFILYSNKQNQGACFCRNIGIIKSSGKYIQFLDSDDFLHPEKINSQVKVLESEKNQIAISDYVYLKNGKVIRTCKNDGNLFKKISFGWSIFTASPLFRSSLIKNKIQWNEKLSMLQDKDFIFKAIMLSGEYKYVPGYTSNYIQHKFKQISDSYSSIKTSQFITMFISRSSFLFSNIFKMKINCILYTLTGIIEIFVQYALYSLKKSIKFIFGNRFFHIVKKFHNSRNE